MASSSDVRNFVYLKEPHLPDRMELQMGQSLHSIPVMAFKNQISEKLGLPSEQLMLMYCGRVLKTGKNLDYYRIQPGVTVYYMIKKVSKPSDSGCGSRVESGTQLQRLLRNPRVHQILRRILSDPLLLSSVTRGGPLEDNPLIQNLASHPLFVTDDRDPQQLIRLLEADPTHADGAELLLEQIGGLVAGERGCSREEVQDDEIVDMLEHSLEEGMEFIDEEESVGLAQEEMFQHSLAINAHQQQQMEVTTEAMPPPPPPPVARQNSNPSTAVSPGITQNMLASALANLSPNPPGSNSGPSSLPTQLPSSSTPSHLLPLPPSSGGPRSLPSNPPLSTTTPQGGVEFRRSSSNPGSFTPLDLQRALQSVATPGTTTTTGGSSVSHTHRREEKTTEQQHQYHIQLQRLQAMGLTDEAACLHALEATRGDLDSALDLLLGGQ